MSECLYCDVNFVLLGDLIRWVYVPKPGGERGEVEINEMEIQLEVLQTQKALKLLTAETDGSKAQVAEVGENAINAVHGMDYVGRRSNGDMAGNTIDWARGSVGIPYAYLFELRDDGEHGFLLPPEYIQPTGEEIWAGVQAMALEIAEIEGLADLRK